CPCASRVLDPSQRQVRPIATRSERLQPGSVAEPDAIPSRLSFGVPPISALRTRVPGDWPTRWPLRLRLQTSVVESSSSWFTPLEHAAQSSLSSDRHLVHTQSRREFGHRARSSAAI